MRAPPSDPHDCVWLLALSMAPIVIRYEERLKAEPITPLAGAAGNKIEWLGQFPDQSATLDRSKLPPLHI